MRESEERETIIVSASSNSGSSRDYGDDQIMIIVAWPSSVWSGVRGGSGGCTSVSDVFRDDSDGCSSISGVVRGGSGGCTSVSDVFRGGS